MMKYPAVTNRQTAIEIATGMHRMRCNAFWSFWTKGGQEPKDEDFGFHHGWFEIGEYRIRADEYAPGPTYSQD